jgi:drug/metabolite transporter (DMT)-like permease
VSDASILPILLSIGAAFFFGTNVVITRRGLNYLDAQAGSMVSIGSTVVFFLIFSPFWMRAEDWFSPGIFVFMIGGLLHPLTSQVMAFEANRRIGPTISATFCATAPFFATITAMIFLQESITFLIGFGSCMTIVGIITLSWDRKGVAKIVVPALILASGAAIIRGVNHTIGKFGLSLMPNPFMAGFVSFTVAFIASILIYRLRTGYLPRPVRLHRTGLWIFMLTGVLIGFAIWCMYGALFTGRVSVASPIISAFPMFTMLVAIIFRQEVVTRRILAGVCLVVVGVVLIGIGAA